MLFHSAGDDIRKVLVLAVNVQTLYFQACRGPNSARFQVIRHPAPIQSLRNFERVRVVPAGSATVTFAVAAADLMMTDEKVRVADGVHC